MDSQSDSMRPSEFDLSGLERWEYEKNLPKARVRALAMGGTGILVSIAGLAIAITSLVAGSSGGLPLAVPLIAVGALLAFFASGYIRSMVEKPDTLVLSEESLSFGSRARAEFTAVEWTDPRIRIVLHDGSARRLKLQAKDRFAIYSIVPNGQVRLPIPQEAFGAILKEAEKRRLRIRHQDLGSVGYITVTAR